MIIQEFTKVAIVPSNYKHWVSKGYDVPPVGGRGGKNGTHVLKVKVSDLLPGSNVRVKCRCDKCQSKFENRVCRNTSTCQKCTHSLNLQGNNYGTKNTKYPTPSFEELHKLHFDEHLSMEDIRRKFNVTRPVVVRWFREHDITPNNHLKRLDIPSREQLYEMHVVRKMHLSDIANAFKTNTKMIRKWMKEYDVEDQEHPFTRRLILPPDKLVLENLHYNEKKTMLDISKIFDVVPGLVRKWFHNYGIELKLYKSPESQAERDIREHLNSLGCDFVKTRKILNNNRELDMYSEKHKLAVEYCGLYWHQEDRVGKRYHLDKLEECNAKGIRLLTVFEDEWLEKPEIVLSIIKSKLGMSTRLYARKCEVRIIPKYQAHEFLLNNHIHGSTNSLVHCYGLFHNNQLVAVMTFGKHHRGRTILVLNRLCFLKNHSIAGGSQKLFKRALEDIHVPIISWSDRRWSDGRIYEVLGFGKEDTLKPDYSYVNGQRRVSKQSRKKSSTGCPSYVKEIDFNRELGFEPIWDCGKVAWIYPRNSTAK